MKVTVAPASAQTTRAAIQELLDHPSSPSVVGVYRNLSKVPKVFRNHPRFEAVQADLVESTIDLTGSDAVIVLTPAKHDGDYVTAAKQISSNIRHAAQEANVKRLVYVSSIGAQYSKGVGEIHSNYISEEKYANSVPEVIFVRNGYFMENWASALPTISSSTPHFYSTIGPLEHQLPMVSARDIGRTCARQALSDWTGSSSQDENSPRIIELHGPRSYSAQDVKEAFEKVTGKDIEIRLVEKEGLTGFFSAFLPRSMVTDFVEMTESFWPGGLVTIGSSSFTHVVRGEDTLVDAFSRVWNASAIE